MKKIYETPSLTKSAALQTIAAACNISDCK